MIAVQNRFRRLHPRTILLLLLSAAYAGYGLRELITQRSATAFSQPEFDGTPLFIPIDGTPVQYATNTSSVILSVGDRFFLRRDGAWFRSSSAAGQYFRIDVVPAELLEIPAAAAY